MNGVERITAERARHLSVKGYTPEHDARHARGQIALAAALYAIPEELRHGYQVPMGGLGHVVFKLGAFLHHRIGWQRGWFKAEPGNRVRELEKAGALIAAEIDRLLLGEQEPQ